MKLTVDTSPSIEALVNVTTTDINIDGGTQVDVSINPSPKFEILMDAMNPANLGALAYQDTVTFSQVVSQPYIEVVDTSSTIALTATPILLQPSTVVSNNGVTYNPSTGVFTFAAAGSYNQVINVNAIASAANQYVYIYAENWNGTAWVKNTYSGKSYLLQNGAETQVTIPNAVKRTAGQQVRYWVYSNGTRVQLKTSLLPTSGVTVPAIRIQYS